MKNILRWPLVLLVILLSSCQTSYTPVGDYGGFPHGGYSDTRVDSNTTIVTFNANAFTKPQDVRAMLMYRAAKITLDNGYNYFVIISMSGQRTNVDINTETNIHDNSTNPPKARRTYYITQDYQSFSTSETDTRHIYCPSPCKNPPHAVSAVIKMFGGSIPPGLPNAYNAYDVLGHLGPAVAQPVF